MNDCENYLGLPMVGGKSKINTYKELQERITKRVMGQKEKLISKAGREVLIKTFTNHPYILYECFQDSEDIGGLNKLSFR